MLLRPPRSTRTDTLLPYTTRCRSQTTRARRQTFARRHPQRTDWPRAHAAPAPPIRECARQISPATHVRLSHRTCTRSANEPTDWRHAALAGGAPTAVPARSARPEATTDLRSEERRVGEERG